MPKPFLTPPARTQGPAFEIPAGAGSSASLPPAGPRRESRQIELQSERRAIYQEERQQTLMRSLIGMFAASPAATASMGTSKPSDILRRQLEELSTRYGSGHPEVVKAADVVALALAMEAETEKAAAPAKEKSR